MHTQHVCSMATLYPRQRCVSMHAGSPTDVRTPGQTYAQQQLWEASQSSKGLCCCSAHCRSRLTARLQGCCWAVPDPALIASWQTCPCLS